MSRREPIVLTGRDGADRRAVANRGGAVTGTVGIDGRSLAVQPTGVGRYVKNLVRELARCDTPIRFRIFLPPADGNDLPPADVVERSVLRMPAGPFGRLDNVFVWNHARLPLHLVRNPVDLLHSPFYTTPALCPCPTVVTIHDVTFDLHPEWFTPKARVAFSGFAAASARRARHILTVSECSRKDIISMYEVPPEKVTAVPLAPDPEFRPVESRDELARVRAKYELPGEFVLHLGSITPRRNVNRLLDAFAAVRGRRPELVLALVGRVEPPAPPVEPEIERRGLGPAVRLTGYADAEDVPALYSAARALVVPSLYEGFGLPVLEAMSCGTPVLASRTSCFPEVAGDAALLVDPLDTEAIADALATLVCNEPVRARLVEMGRARAATFHWERTARGTLEVYERALAGRGGA